VRPAGVRSRANSGLAPVAIELRPDVIAHAIVIRGKLPMAIDAILTFKARLVLSIRREMSEGPGMVLRG